MKLGLEQAYASDLCVQRTSDAHIANRSLYARTGVDFPMLSSS